MTQHTPSPLHAIESRLANLRRRARTMLVAAGSAYVVAVVFATLLAAALIDYVVRTPDWFRVLLLLAGLVGVVMLIRRHVRPATRFDPSLSEVALRVENSEAGRRAGLEGILTSGLELQHTPDTAPTLTKTLSERVIARADELFRSFSPAVLLDTRMLRRRLGLLAASAAALVGVAALAGPGLTRTAAARLLAPWAGTQWPKRTEVVDATSAKVHPLGQALSLRAALTRTPRGPSETRVVASYRLLGPGVDSAVRTLPLTGQARDIIVESAGGETLAGELYERLVDLDLPPEARTAELELEFWITTDDDSTAPVRLRLVEPPALISASASITPPEYAGTAPANFVHGARELGSGSDARAVVGPILAGSRVELSFRFNKPLPAPPAGTDLTTFLSGVSPGATEPWPPPSLTASFKGDTWTLAFPADQTRRWPMRPVDEFGLAPREESAFSLDVTPDRVPAAVVLDPRDDQSVLASAVVPLVGEGRDDVGLASLTLQWVKAAPKPGSVGAAPEPVGEPATLAEMSPESVPPLSAPVEATLELATLGVQAGDEVWISVLARDGFASHEPVRSTPRKLRIISEQQLLDQVRGELGNLRRAAIRLETDQAELTKPVDAGRVSAEDRRRQDGLAQRLEQQREGVERLADRLERNRLDDSAMRDMLDEAQELVSSARDSANRAAQQLNQAAQENPQDPTPLTEQQRDAARAQQDEARDQLAKLAELLDKGEDSWVAARSVQRLLEQQRLAQAQTRSAGQETQGAKPEDLTPAQRQRLSELGQQQQRLAEQARQAIDQLAQRAQQMQSVDQAQAQGMKQAEQRAREQELAQAMQRAAQAIEQNQTSQAEAQQQQAVEALEQMMQDMQNARQNRQAQLKRVVEELVQSITRLVARQEAELALLTKAEGDIKALDRGMIELNQQTLAAAEQARGDRTLAPVAAPLERAADEQGKAVVALRAADAKAAETAERESLRLLQEALDQAKKQKDQADDAERDRQRAELRAAYAQSLELQVALKAETDAFVGKQLQRRERIAVRGLGERQEAIRASLEELRKKTKELEDSTVFQLAHDRLDASGNVASKKLRDGTADAAAARNQSSIVATLRALVQALDEAKRDDDPFREDEQGGGGGGQGGGQKPPLIPPLAELRLLRGIQADVAERTRGADEAKDDAEVRRLADEQEALAKRGQELAEKVKAQQPGGNAKKDDEKQEGGKPE